LKINFVHRINPNGAFLQELIASSGPRSFFDKEKDDEERKAFHANRALSRKKYLYFLSGIFMQRKKKNSEILETLSGYDPA